MVIQSLSDVFARAGRFAYFKGSNLYSRALTGATYSQLIWPQIESRRQAMVESCAQSLVRLNNIEAKILKQLNTTGVCVTTVDELLGAQAAAFNNNITPLQKHLAESANQLNRQERLIKESLKLDGKELYSSLLNDGLNDNLEEIILLGTKSPMLKIAQHHFGQRVAYDGVQTKIVLSNGRHPTASVRRPHGDFESLYLDKTSAQRRGVIKIIIYHEKTTQANGCFQALSLEQSQEVLNKKGLKLRIDFPWWDPLEKYIASPEWIPVEGEAGTAIVVNTSQIIHCQGLIENGQSRSSTTYSFASLPACPYMCERQGLENFWKRERLAQKLEEQYQKDAMLWPNFIPGLLRLHPRLP